MVWSMSGPRRIASSHSELVHLFEHEFGVANCRSRLRRGSCERFFRTSNTRSRNSQNAINNFARWSTAILLVHIRVCRCGDRALDGEGGGK